MLGTVSWLGRIQEVTPKCEESTDQWNTLITSVITDLQKSLRTRQDVPLDRAGKARSGNQIKTRTIKKKKEKKRNWAIALTQLKE